MSAVDRVWREVNALPVWKAPATPITRTEPIPVLTERPLRLRSINGGKCPTCGDRFHGCPCEEED